MTDSQGMLITTQAVAKLPMTLVSGTGGISTGCASIGAFVPTDLLETRTNGGGGGL